MPTSFDVTFYGNHLDVDWNMKYEKITQVYELIGKLIGCKIDF